MTDSQEKPKGGVDLNTMSAEEKERRLSTMNPQLVLNSLADFVNGQELTQKRIQQIGRRFVALDDFNTFKIQVNNDEERKNAQQDMSKQIKQIQAKMQDMDSASLNLENDLSQVRTELR